MVIKKGFRKETYGVVEPLKYTGMNCSTNKLNFANSTIIDQMLINEN